MWGSQIIEGYISKQCKIGLWGKLVGLLVSNCTYQLSIGTKIGDLEWPSTALLWSPYGIGQTIRPIFLPCDFFLLLFFLPNLSRRRVDVTYHMSGHRRTTLSGYIFATKARIDNRKKPVKQQYLLHIPHNMVNFGLLAAEIVSSVWGTANFSGFRVLASLLQRRRSTEANQTLHTVWSLPGLVDYMYVFGGCLEVCQVQSSLCVFQVLRSPIRSVTARQSSSGREPNFYGVEHRAPPIFGRATIRLDIGPHSNCPYFALFHRIPVASGAHCVKVDEDIHSFIHLVWTIKFRT